MMTFRPATAAVLLLASLSARALDFNVGPVYGSVLGEFSLGAVLRMEDRDPALIAKTNLAPGLCTRTNRTSNPGASSLEYPGAQPQDIGSTCNSTTDPSLNLAYVKAPGSYNINGDNGNLNFDRNDLVAASAYLKTRFNLAWDRFSLNGRTIWFFDSVYTGFDEQHPDTTLQPARSPLAPTAEQLFGHDVELTELFLSTDFSLGERLVSVRLGRHGLNWGESTALPLNSMNTINPPDLRLTRIPGFNLDDLFQPVGLLSIGTGLTLNLSAELFYQYEWRPAVIDAPGSFQSTSDTFGGDAAEGYYAMLSFGKAPEDPQALYASQDNPDDPFALGSGGSRTIYRLADREPRDHGQYGLALKYFAENLNNGTEFSFYFANYHSRIPTASFIAADASCAQDSINLIELLGDCGALQGSNGTLMLAGEPLPVDTVRVFAEYPEDIQLFGASFNTSLGEWAWSGEYAFRPYMPLQIHTVDLIFAALQPAFPRHNLNVGVPDLSGTTGLPLELLEQLSGLAGAPATVLPGRRVAVPDYIETLYRGNEVQPGDVIRGYERVQMGQLTSTLIRTFGAANPLRASQIAVILEAGLTHVLDMPSLSELQFQGDEANTHASNGADGSLSGVGDSARFESDGDGDPRCLRQSYDSIGGAEAEPCRQNPTSQDPDAFGDALAWGIRSIYVARYQNAFAGTNLDALLGVFYDVDGVAPGVGQNFSEGNSQIFLGFQVEYLARWFGDIRYTWLDGERNPRRDRDTLAFTLRYAF